MRSPRNPLRPPFLSLLRLKAAMSPRRCCRARAGGGRRIPRTSSLPTPQQRGRSRRALNGHLKQISHSSGRVIVLYLRIMATSKRLHRRPLCRPLRFGAGLLEPIPPGHEHTQISREAHLYELSVASLVFWPDSEIYMRRRRPAGHPFSIFPR